MLGVEVLERSIVLLVKANQNRHDFAHAQPARPIALVQAMREQLLMPDGFKVLAEIIDATEEFF